MKSKGFILLITLVITLLAFGISASSGASSAPKVTGAAHFEFPEWGVTGKAEVNVIYVAHGEAKGHFNIEEKAALVYRRLKAHPICIAFGEGHFGEPAASFVLQLDSIRGWNPWGEKAGQYIKLWLSDGGTPAPEGDFAGSLINIGVDDQPSCDYELPPQEGTWLLNAGGNIVIHP